MPDRVSRLVRHRLTPGTHLVPRASRALAGEGARDPRVLVGPVPDGDTDAAVDGHARRDDAVVVRLLLREERRRRGERHADVELGDCDLDALRRERRKVLLQAGRGELADDEVALEAYTIERHVRGLEALDKVQHRRRLRARLLDVVVVDIELRVRVRASRGVQGDLDVVGAEGVVEHVSAPGTVIVEGLY